MLVTSAINNLIWGKYIPTEKKAGKKFQYVAFSFIVRFFWPRSEHSISPENAPKTLLFYAVPREMLVLF